MHFKTNGFKRFFIDQLVQDNMFLFTSQTTIIYVQSVTVILSCLFRLSTKGNNAKHRDPINGWLT